MTLKRPQQSTALPESKHKSTITTNTHTHTLNLIQMNLVQQHTHHSLLPITFKRLQWWEAHSGWSGNLNRPWEDSPHILGLNYSNFTEKQKHWVKIYINKCQLQDHLRLIHWLMCLYKIMWSLHGDGPYFVHKVYKGELKYLPPVEVHVSTWPPPYGKCDIASKFHLFSLKGILI